MKKEVRDCRQGRRGKGDVGDRPDRPARPGRSRLTHTVAIRTASTKDASQDAAGVADKA